MFPYWILFGAFAAGSFSHLPSRLSGRRISPFLALALIAMALMIGLRYQVGPDWWSYDYLFKRSANFSFEYLTTERGDPAFYGLMWLNHRLGAGIWFLNIVCALIFTAGLSAFARRQPNPWLAVSATIPYLVLVVAMSGTRQATAIGFLFLALAAFSDKRLFRAAIWLFLGALFHASVILMAGLAALSFTRNRLQSVVVLIVTAVVGTHYLMSNFDVYMLRYSGNVQSSGAIYRVLMNVAPAALYLLWPRRFPAEEHERVFWRNVAILAVLTVPAYFVVPSSTALDRLSLYLAPLQAYVLNRAPQAFARTQGEYRRLVALLLCYLALIMFVFLKFAKHAKHWDPYQFYPLAMW